MTVRKCAYEDIGYLCKMWADYVSPPWKAEDIVTALKNPDYLFLAAEENRQIIGFLCACKVLDEAEICAVATGLSSRKQGIATALIEECALFMGERGVKTVFLEVNEINSAAYNLYLKNGFKEIYRRKKYYGENAAVIMERKI